MKLSASITSRDWPEIKTLNQTSNLGSSGGGGHLLVPLRGWSAFAATFKVMFIEEYRENLDFAKILISVGIIISFSGIVTFKNATNTEVVENISLDDFMLETDCPFLAPHPYRGRKNEPKYVLTIAEKIAELRGETLEQIALSTSKNAEQFFNI